MKRKVFMFILVVLTCLLILPLFNGLRQGKMPWGRLYKLDTALNLLSSKLYPLGISIDPDKVLIGREGWLFLGNIYEDVIATNRQGITASVLTAAKVRNATLAAWIYWYKYQGIEFLGHALLPNKDTIYPDKTPGWASPRPPSPSDALLAAPYATYYFDARPGLTGARRALPNELLYLKTDTHWNAWGAWLSYQSLGNWLENRVPVLRWPKPTNVKLQGWEKIPGGDLARFLRLSTELQDEAPILDASGLSGVNLNPDKKLLWIRDSFGDAWEPYMKSTFSAVSSLHWRDALDHGGSAILEQVREFRPDYVLYSVVERSLYAEAFTVPPPLLVSKNSRGFIGGTALRYPRTNDMTKTDVSGLKIYGVDPYWEFDLRTGIVPAETPVLAVNLVCEPLGEQSVNFQLFWAGSKDSGYSQLQRSVAFQLRPGVNYVHLATSPLWVLTEGVDKIRLDLETFDACQLVDVANVRFGSFVD